MRKRARLMVLTVPLYTAIGRITTALDDEDDDAADADADDDADAGAETIVRLLSLYRVAIVLQYFQNRTFSFNKNNDLKEAASAYVYAFRCFKSAT